MTFPQKGVGGIQNFILTLDSSLKKLKIASEIISVYSFTGEAFKFFRLPLFGIIPYRLILSILKAFTFSVRCRQGHFIIHAHDMTFGGLTGALIKLLTRRPFVITDHGIQSTTETYRYVKRKGNTSLSRLNTIFLLLMEKFVAGQADKTMHVNESTHNYFLKIGVNPAKMEIVRTGVNVDTFRPSSPIFSESNVRMVYAGRISAEKGVNALLKVFSVLEKTHQNLMLRIVGEGPDETDVREMARKLRIMRINFSLPIHRSRMEKVYNDSDIIVVPSTLETGTPLTLLEAMACERLIIINSVGSLPSIVDNAGLKVRFSHPSEAAKLIDNILNDRKTARKLAKLARERVMEHFNWSDCFNKILRIYVKQVSSRG